MASDGVTRCGEWRVCWSEDEGGWNANCMGRGGVSLLLPSSYFRDACQDMTSLERNVVKGASRFRDREENKSNERGMD